MLSRRSAKVLRMPNYQQRTVATACIVALGGFLMGFDVSVISGVVGLIEKEFSLSKVQLGWSVASLTLTATLAMMTAGPVSDRIGRRRTLQLAALLFAVSALGSTGYIAAVTAGTLAAADIAGSAAPGGLPTATSTLGTAAASALLSFLAIPFHRFQPELPA